jgi:hypothetical protein
MCGLAWTGSFFGQSNLLRAFIWYESEYYVIAIMPQWGLLAWLRKNVDHWRYYHRIEWFLRSVTAWTIMIFVEVENRPLMICPD